MGVGGNNGTGVPPTYSGPLDVQSGVDFWWGLRAASHATLGNKLINVCNSTGGSDVGCADLSSNATTGALVAATVSGITCPGNANCTIKIFYDLSGNGYDVTEATIAGRAKLLNSGCYNSVTVCASTSAATSPCYIAAKTKTQAQPYTVIFAAGFVNVTVQQTVVSESSDVMEVGNNGSQLYLANTAARKYGATSNTTLYASQGVFNGSSSSGTINGTTTSSLNPGSGGFTATDPVLFGFGAAGPSCGGQSFSGQFLEGGVFNGVSSVIGAMNSNMRGAYGGY